MKRRLVGALAAVALSACGLVKVNVNGKDVVLGAPEPQPQAQAPQADPQQPQSAPQQKPAVANDNRVVQTIQVNPAQTDYPTIVVVDGVSVDGSFSKVIGGREPECSNRISTKPVAALELKQAMPKEFQLALLGGHNDGFVLKKGDVFWSACTYTISEVPTMAAPAEGWQPGVYEVYPVARSGGTSRFTLELSNPANRATWSDAVQKLSLSKKLEKPMIVEVTTKPGRKLLRDLYSGYGCGRVPLAAEPDLSLTLERPIPGLIIRPLPTKSPITMRVQETDTKNKRKYCAQYQRTVAQSDYDKAPTWEAPSEVHFDREAEGTFGISLGTANADEAQKVTLMIFDESTQFDALTLVPPSGELTLAERELHLHFPQLNVRKLSFSTYDAVALQTKIFKAAPKELFVYSKLDLDKDIARSLQSGVEEQYPRKNEPLLVLDTNENHSTVMAADGLHYQVKTSHLLLKPDGAVALPAAPRALKKDASFSTVLSLMPPAAKPIYEAHQARMKKYDDCADRVWAPYEKQLPSISAPAGAQYIVIESARTKQIKEAGNRAIDKQCGTSAMLDKDKDSTRIKLLGEVEKERVKLLAQAKPSL